MRLKMGREAREQFEKDWDGKLMREELPIAKSITISPFLFQQKNIE
jgi:hypothetical protein